MSDIEYLKTKFQYHNDWPKPGIVFCDILPALQDPLAFELLITNFVNHILTTHLPTKIDVVVGLDARGFLLGPLVALRLGCSFVPVRKRGKLPGTCHSATYLKEYGEDIFEIQKDSIPSGSNVIVIDDLIATGGSAKAAGQLVSKCNATTLEYLFVVAIPFLKGEQQLDAPSYHLVEMD